MERYYQMFVAQMDSIYYEGYVAEIATSNPSKLKFEWEEFLRLIK
jgi:hypothetical protein